MARILSLAKQQEIIRLHKQGMTQRQIARKVHETKSTVDRCLCRLREYERGDRETPYAETRYGPHPDPTPEEIAERAAEERKKRKRGGRSVPREKMLPRIRQISRFLEAM